MPFAPDFVVEAESGPAASNSRAFDCAQSILEALPFYVLLVDADHNILAANQRVIDTYGADAVCGGFCPRVVHGVDHFLGCPLERAIATHQPVETEFYDPAKAHWMASAVYPTTLRTRAGLGVFLHFARDVTQLKHVEGELSRSLEHHRAIAQLLQGLSGCSSAEECLGVLLDVTLDLSWMGLGKRALAFLMREDTLELVVCRNLDSTEAARCGRVKSGECVCGRVAQTGRPVLLSATELATSGIAHAGTDDHGHASVPLVHDGRVLGVVTFYLSRQEQLDQHKLSFLKAAADVAAAAVAQQITRREAREAEERARHLEHQLMERVLSSHEEERKRLSRDLHDDLGQAMSVLLLELAGAPPGGLSAEFRNHVAESVREFARRVYDLSRDLRPAILDDLGLDSAIANYTSRLSARTGLLIDCQLVKPPHGEARMDPALELQLYRITQEALSNVARHAEASRVSVIVLRSEREVTLLIEDDGRGFDVHATRSLQGPGGLGLTGMKERVTLMHGKFLVESAPGRGTSIKATIPLVNAVAQSESGDGASSLSHRNM